MILLIDCMLLLSLLYTCTVSVFFSDLCFTVCCHLAF